MCYLTVPANPFDSQIIDNDRLEDYRQCVISNIRVDSDEAISRRLRILLREEPTHPVERVIIRKLLLRYDGQPVTDDEVEDYRVWAVMEVGDDYEPERNMVRAQEQAVMAFLRKRLQSTETEVHERPLAAKLLST